MSERDIDLVLDEVTRWLYGESLRLFNEHRQHIKDRCLLK